MKFKKTTTNNPVKKQTLNVGLNVELNVELRKIVELIAELYGI